MKKILFFAANIFVCIGIACGAVRDGTPVSRTKSSKTTTQSQARTATTVKRNTAARATALVPRERTSNTQSRKNTTRNASPRTSTNNAARTSVVSRAASKDTFSMSDTRIGAEYEKCKNTYFSCMDQFCKLKNDDYRRCSCNDRVFSLADKRKTLTDAGDQLTVFTENLEVVGMTAAQATAMRTESEGETALKNDKSASQALLQAIMNSIRGTDSNVNGKYSDLNSINISFDTTNAFGMTDVGQAIAAYNGNALYSAVYPQCRDAVRKDCNDSSLQRAVNAYLMAIEQDCNTVQTAIEKTQKQMKSAVRESSAMLDLARVENRKTHNSLDIASCINAVESAILSEEVCGANYHKCLDNGEYIDISTGKPIIGVKDFYKLQNLLTFSTGVDAASQKLSQNKPNRQFVQRFEKRVKKFAADALDKCVENADVVWSEYLDKALLSIYYAQQDKVSEIKQTCFDYITNCYASTEKTLETSQSGISEENTLVLQPDNLVLKQKMCTDYIKSCDSMFDNNIIQDYVANANKQDTETACRAAVKQCFDRYGGTNYENFYYSPNGLFEPGKALDWFVYNSDAIEHYAGSVHSGTSEKNKKFNVEPTPCIRLLASLPACNKEESREKIFGGFDLAMKSDVLGGEKDASRTYSNLRPTGVATEVYNQIIAILSKQCETMNGRFIPKTDFQYYAYYNRNNTYNKSINVCKIYTDNNDYNTSNSIFLNNKIEAVLNKFNLTNGEDICPANYQTLLDTFSWGICSCFENGGRRSNNGRSSRCLETTPAKYKTESTKGGPSNKSCDPETMEIMETDIDGTEKQDSTTENPENWCTLPITASTYQLCPFGYTAINSGAFDFEEDKYKDSDKNLEEPYKTLNEKFKKFEKFEKSCVNFTCPDNLVADLEHMICHTPCDEGYQYTYLNEKDFFGPYCTKTGSSVILDTDKLTYNTNCNNNNNCYRLIKDTEVDSISFDLLPNAINYNKNQ